MAKILTEEPVQWLAVKSVSDLPNSGTSPLTWTYTQLPADGLIGKVVTLELFQGVWFGVEQAKQ